MLRYFQKKGKESSCSSSLASSPTINSPATKESRKKVSDSSNDDQVKISISSSNQFDPNSLAADPVDRKPILEYSPDVRDEVRRYYILKGPYQPRNHDFPQTEIYGIMRRFNSSWFDGSYGDWLEYSIKADAAFCLCCYLFKSENEGHGGATDCFTSKGFTGWNRINGFKKHIGEVNSVHDQCFKKMLDLRRQSQSIQTAFDKQSEKTKSEYRTRLNASLDVSRLLLSCGLPFRGHDEHELSRNRGNFLTILKWHAERNEDVGRVVLKNAPGNQQMTSPSIQKDIFYAVVDRQLQELNNRFDEVNTELLLGVASLNPADSFANYDKDKVMRLAQYYPDDFDYYKLRDLDSELDNFIFDMRHNDERFFNLKGIGDLSKKLVETKKHITWSNVYLLVKLALILPVATATVERAFSAMKYVKNDLRNRMCNQFLNDCLLTYIEDDVFESIPNDVIIDRFQNMKTRRGQL